MLTIKQAGQFSDILKEHKLYKDANQVDKYILLASASPIEKHAGLWDWVGGKLSGWSKRIFFKNFRQAYSLAQDIQKELDKQMDAVEEQHKQTHMYLNRHDLTNWQRTISELAVNVTPTDTLSNLQERYNDSLQEMNRGIGLLSNKQQEELREEQKKQREEREQASGTPPSEAPSSEAPDVDAPNDVETEEEQANIRNPEELSSYQQYRSIKYDAPAHILRWLNDLGYLEWARTSTFYNPEFGGKNQIVIPEPLLKRHVDLGQFDVKRNPDEKVYYKVIQEEHTSLPSEWSRTFASPEMIDRCWVAEESISAPDGVTWWILGSVDPKILDLYNVNLKPKLPFLDDLIRSPNTDKYNFYVAKDQNDNTIYLPLREAMEGVQEKFITDIREAGTIFFGKLDLEQAPSEWTHTLSYGRGEGQQLRFDTRPEGITPDTWVKITKIGTTERDRELRGGGKAPLEEVDTTQDLSPEDINTGDPDQQTRAALKRVDKIIALAMMT